MYVNLGEDDFEMIALLLVCVSVTLPRLADSEYAIYVPQLQCSKIID